MGITTVVGNTVVDATVVDTIVVGTAVVGIVDVGIAVVVIDDWQVVPVKPTSHTPTTTLNTLVSNTSHNMRKY